MSRLLKFQAPDTRPSRCLGEAGVARLVFRQVIGGPPWNLNASGRGREKCRVGHGPPWGAIRLRRAARNPSGAMGFRPVVNTMMKPLMTKNRSTPSAPIQ